MPPTRVSFPARFTPGHVAQQRCEEFLFEHVIVFGQVCPGHAHADAGNLVKGQLRRLQSAVNGFLDFLVRRRYAVAFIVARASTSKSQHTASVVARQSEGLCAAYIKSEIIRHKLLSPFQNCIVVQTSSLQNR